MNPLIGVVEGLVLRPGARDVAGLAVPTLGSVGKLAAELLAARTTVGTRLGLVTGAFMAWAGRPAAETDGPVGVAALTRLCGVMGIPVAVVTDDLCAPVISACLDRLEARAELRAVTHTAAPEEVLAAAQGWGLSHVIAVERLGPGADGRVRTMRGLDNTAVTAPLHVLFADLAVHTAAVGDGGNEVGMGSLPVEHIAAHIENGRLIACRVPVEHLVVAGTSNWGCYALVAVLGLLEPSCAGTATELLSPATDESLVAAAVAAGAVDGVLGRAEMRVDGMQPSAYRPLMQALGVICAGRDGWAAAS